MPLDDMNPSSINWTDSGELEVLTFDLRGETFALEAVLVREIVDLIASTAVPGASSLVGGIINFRGKIIPLADLGLAFDMPAGEASVDSRIIVIELTIGEESCFVGLRTDKVHEVATLRASASEEPPIVGMSWRRDYVRRLVRRENDIVVLPDLDAIFAPTAGLADAIAGAATSVR